jgi:hypothetical protein
MHAILLAVTGCSALGMGSKAQQHLAMLLSNGGSSAVFVPFASAGLVPAKAARAWRTAWRLD